MCCRNGSRFTEGYYLIIYALAVIVLLIFSPTGILGLVERILNERRAKAASAMRAAAQSKLEQSNLETER